MQDRVAHLETIESQTHGQSQQQQLLSPEGVKFEPFDLDLSSVDYSASPLALTHNSDLNTVASDNVNCILSPTTREGDYPQLGSPLTQNTLTGSSNQFSQNFGANWQDSFDVLGTDFLSPTYTGLQQCSDFHSNHGLNSSSSASFGNYHLRETPLHVLDPLLISSSGTELNNTQPLQNNFTHDPFNVQYDYVTHGQQIPSNNVDYSNPLFYSGNGPGPSMQSQLPDDQYHHQHLPLLDLPRNEDQFLFQSLSDFNHIPFPQLPELPLPGRNDLHHQEHEHMQNYLNIPEFESGTSDRPEHAAHMSYHSQSPGPPGISKTNHASSSSHDSRKQGAKPLTLKDLTHDDSRFAKVVMAFVSISDEKRRTVTEIAKQVSVLYPDKYADFEYVKVCVYP
jgi:hypothetical protein